MNQAHKRLLGVLMDWDEEMESEARNAELLTAYVDCEQAGGNPQEKFPEFHALLQTRLDLQDQLGALRIMLGSTEQYEELSVSTAKKQYDLSFLRPTLWDQAATHLYRLRTQLTVRVQEQVSRLIDLDPLLTPYHRFVPAPVMRATSEAKPEPLEVQELPIAEQNRKIVLTLWPAHQQRGAIEVAIQENVPTGEPRRASIALYTREGQLLQRTALSLSESIKLSNLALDEYLIVVQENQTKWEIRIHCR